MADIAAPGAAIPADLPLDIPADSPVHTTTIDRRRCAGWAELAPFVLMMVITTGLFGCIGLLMFHSVPPDNHDILIGVTSSIATVWIAGGAFFFGSSAASKVKDTALATLASKATPTGGQSNA